MKCPFCGAEFDEPKSQCNNCPLRRSCSAKCCPNCGYELSRDSKLVELGQKLISKFRKENKDGDSRAD